MLRVMLIGAAVVAASAISPADLFAQRDAGAKARGEERAFWDYGRGAYRGGDFADRIVRRDDVDTGRRFSYEPMAIGPGDVVTVSRDNVRVMRGTNVVGDIAKGAEFKVTGVIGGWLGIVTEIDGKKLNGWVWHENVSAAATKDEAQPQQPAARVPTRTERRYSYEPEPARSRMRVFEPRRSPWDFPKTDPRRYRP